jgi:hypothetical protein
VQLSISDTVALERETITVVAEPVGFDDQRLLSPEEINLPPTDADVDVRPREATPTAQPQEEPLELAPSDIGLRREILIRDQLQVQRPPRGLLRERS